MKKEDVEKALECHGNRVMSLAYSYLHSVEDAEDVLQETMVKLFQRTEKFNDEEHEKAWLLRVASNISKNMLRSRKYIADTEDGTVPEDILTEDMPEESIALYQAVSSLPEKYREVVHLYYYEDVSTYDIARILEKKESTVRSLLHRARGMLEKELTES